MTDSDPGWWASRRQRFREANDWRGMRYFGIAYLVLSPLLFVLSALRHTWVMLPIWLLMFAGGVYIFRESRIMRVMQADDRWRT